MSAFAMILAATLAVAEAGEYEEPVAAQAASGVSGEGRWLVGASAGYPWSGLRAQLGLQHGLSPLVEVD
ncbi:MAG TPA: hypothetical protein PKW35_02545, partial [Nannocystaceae bacterium]|nr:hypothetical protein [Nannocystaceae bacterium]